MNLHHPEHQQQQPQQPGMIGSRQHGQHNGSTSASSWFIGTPVSKSIIVCMSILFIVVHSIMPTTSYDHNSNQLYEAFVLDPWKQYHHHHRQFYYSFITSKIMFTTTSDFMIGISFLSFLLQKYEREMSSSKFLSFLGITLFLSIIMEYIFIHISYYIHTLASSSLMVVLLRSILSYHTIQYLGPYPLYGIVFTLFHFYSPRLYPKLIHVHHMIHFSEKSFYYIWFFYIISRHSNHTNNDNANNRWMVLFSYDTIAPTTIGMISCLIYLSSSKLQHLNIIPNWLSKIWKPISAQLSLQYTPPLLIPIIIGNNIMLHNVATTAVGGAGSRGGGGGGIVNPQQPQRQQNLFHRGNSNNSNHHHHHLLHRRGQRGSSQQQPMLQQQVQQPPPQPQNQTSVFDATAFGIPIPEPDHDAIEQLTSMGFERQQVIAALRACHNNIEHAADRLLSSSTSS